MGSRGSVIPYFLVKPSLCVTDNSSRYDAIQYFASDGVSMVFWALQHALGGELFVPKIPSYRITDVAEAIAPKCEKPIVGIRPGEKLHEQMITNSDSPTTIDLGDYYAILPSDGSLLGLYREKGINFSSVDNNFVYDSSSNPDFLSVQQIRELIRQHVCPEFVPIA